MQSENPDNNLVIQYSIVGIILLLACVWIVWKIIRNNKKKNNSCCGCALSDSCKKMKK